MRNGELEITMRSVDDIREYDNNPRGITDNAVKYVAKSIRRFGFLQPVVVDADGVIVCGHVRYRAAKSLKLDSVPCVVADDLSPAQARAFRIADNKVASIATWDNEKLRDEFSRMTSAEFSMEGLGFDAEMLSGGGVSTMPADGDLGGVDIEDTGREIDCDDFGDETFKHECPHCGLKF